VLPLLAVVFRANPYRLAGAADLLRGPCPEQTFTVACMVVEVPAHGNNTLFYCFASDTVNTAMMRGYPAFVQLNKW
jgi:hypothetical protein